jgi:ABC-type Na+ transport system ATPase subunit NatA
VSKISPGVLAPLHEVLTPDEWRARGRERRRSVFRSSHAQRAPPADRPGPVTLLEEQAKARVPDLIPIRYGRMIASPFAYFRGAAAPMAWDLAHTPTPDIRVLRVLRGVDFEVARGSIFALLGSNGAGKTTVVKILSTLLKAEKGTVRVNGFDVATQAADVRESISLTAQFAAVDEILSGRENLVLVARLRHLRDPGAIADDLLRRFSLTGAAGTRRAATYSGGMRRRLDIAMSLIGNPPVIFLDEPTAGLDPQARIEVWQAVKELAEGGTTWSDARSRRIDFCRSGPQDRQPPARRDRAA